MSFDRKDFTALAAKQRGAKVTADHQPGLIQLRQAAVAAEQMMGTPEWDVFLSYLEAAKQEAVKMRAGYVTDLTNPRIVDQNEIAKLRIAVFRLDDRIQTLAAVIAMPHEIRKHGHVAAERLKELTKLEEETKAA